MTKWTRFRLAVYLLLAGFFLSRCAPLPETRYVPVSPVITPSKGVPAQQLAKQILIKVSILHAENNLSFKVGPSPAMVLKDKGSREFTLKPGANVIVYWRPEGLLLQGSPFAAAKTLRFRLQQPGSFKIKGRYYSGDIILAYDNSRKPLIIEEVSLEKYLYGVLVGEVSQKWPLETLKAQAVASRTFAIYSMQKSQGRDFDIENGDMSQVYVGVPSSIEPDLEKAIASTTGVIMRYQGQPIAAYYHSTCGGMTEDAANVWSQDIPYLRGVPCGFCRDSKHYWWSASINKERMSGILTKNHLISGALQGMRIADRTVSGRVNNLEAFTDKGLIRIKSSSFRLAVGSSVIRSTNFDLFDRGDTIKFEGKGWGHGVGLCQSGAYGMGVAGWNYAQILQHYYTGIEISRVY